MYQAAVPPSLQGIDRARHLLARIREQGREELLSTSLSPDMFDCATQLVLVGDFALRSTYLLTDKSIPEREEAPARDAESLDAGLALAARYVRALPQEAFQRADTRTVRHVAGDAKLEQTGHDYLTLFALPNLWFHLSMAFAIARAGGLSVGKADYDGWHSYAPGFSFVAS